MSFVGAAILAAGAIGAGASIYSGYQQSQANQAAAQTIAQGQQRALNAQKQYLGPYAQFGQSLQPTLTSLLTPGPSQTNTLNQLPGFQFAKDIATEGVAAGAGRTGISGTTAVEGGTLASNIAAQNWRQFVDPLVSLYGTGAGAAGSIAGNTSNIYTGGAQSLAGLQVGQGNILAGAAGGVGNSLQNALLFNALRGGGAAANNPGAFGAGGMFGTGTQFMGGGNWITG